MKLIKPHQISAVLVAVLILTLQAFAADDKPSAPAIKPAMAKLCMNCHQPLEGNLRGNFDNVAFKAHSIQIKLDDAVEILKFDDNHIEVLVEGKTSGADALRSIKKGHEVRVAYVEKDGVKTATLVSTKPPIKLAQEMLITTEEVEKLVAQGPEAGKYTLVDCRPLPRVQEGMIPTAINIPYPAFDKMVDKLPKDKNALLVYYCNGVTCNMSPASSDKAKKLGYTNIKVYRDGMPAWLQRNAGVISAQFLKEAWLDKEIPHILIDARPSADAGKGFITGAVAVDRNNVTAVIAKFPTKDMKPPIMVYDQNNGDEAKMVAAALIAAGYTKINVIPGGFDTWKASAYPIQTGKLNTTIVYVPKPRPGELAIEEFSKLVTQNPPGTLILDVRNSDEAAEGMLKIAKNIPDEELTSRLAELSKDKQIVTHCSTGVRAEMAYHKLKEKGYSVRFLNAKIDIDKDGNYKLERP